MQVNAVIMIIGVAIGLLFGGASMLFVWASAGVTLFGFLMFFVSMKNDITVLLTDQIRMRHTYIFEIHLSSVRKRGTRAKPSLIIPRL